MSDAATATATATAPTTPKKAKGKAAAVNKKPRVKPSHPKTADMVTAAIKNLKERGGSSLQAIKKYISVNYKVDAEKMAPFIRKYLKNAVTTGSLVQTKGKGASGSFKLSVGPAEKKVIAKPMKPKAPKVKKSKPATVKPATEKKSGTSAAKKVPVKPKVAKPTTPSKAKKTKKAPTKKPKAPKPKKVGAAKSPKKAAPKKK